MMMTGFMVLVTVQCVHICLPHTAGCCSQLDYNGGLRLIDRCHNAHHCITASLHQAGECIININRNEWALDAGDGEGKCSRVEWQQQQISWNKCHATSIHPSLSLSLLASGSSPPFMYSLSFSPSLLFPSQLASCCWLLPLLSSRFTANSSIVWLAVRALYN